jgi:hypothetical protein
VSRQYEPVNVASLSVMKHIAGYKCGNPGIPGTHDHGSHSWISSYDRSEDMNSVTIVAKYGGCC